MSETRYCSFCAGAHPGEVEYLVTSFGVYICDQCVDQAAAIIAEKRAEHPQIQQSTNPSE